jgi:hypothetical protein
MKEGSSGYWPYSGDVGNPRYEKDRSELFASNGNGWWYFMGYRYWGEDLEILNGREKRSNGLCKKD